MIRRSVLIMALATLIACAPPAMVSPLAAGVVSSPEATAAEVGAAILRAGGNAVDAAVATQFALSVTNPYGGNIGGGGFMMIHEPTAGSPRVSSLDFREKAPAAATRDMFLDSAGQIISGESLYSHRAAGVPGTVRGLWEAHRRFGTMPWRRLVEPAVRLAESGFALDAWTAESIETAALRHAELDPERRRMINFSDYFSGATGDRLIQPELGATLRRIATVGADEFYSGETARLLVEEMKRGGGLITEDDLSEYQPAWREPVVGSYRGFRIASMPPPSSGGIILLEMLRMLELFELPSQLSARHLHLLAEIEKRAFADRAEHLGDPDFHQVPAKLLLSSGYARDRASTISLDKRTDPQAIRAGGLAGAVASGGETTHLSVVDRDGMAVSCTTTLNAGYGSGIVVRGAGFLLNNEMDDFSVKPGAPNLYGVTGDEANAIGPGKRMLSSMSPTFVYSRDGKLWLILGSPGGPTILTTILQIISDKIDYGMTLDEAVSAPRAHHQWPPPAPDEDPIFVESSPRYRLPDETLDGLRAYGYTLVERETIGDVQAIEIIGRRAIGVADARRTGGVVSE